MTILGPTVNPREYLEQVRDEAVDIRHKDLTVRQTTEDLREWLREVVCEDEKLLLAMINRMRENKADLIGTELMRNYNTWVGNEATKAGDDAWNSALTRLVDSREAPFDV